MAEPRNIVLILGNGFDIDLGLKTSYKDFWESEFCPKDYPAPLIHHLNERWPDNKEGVRWYDLENEFLQYYKSIPDPQVGKDYLTDKEKKLIASFDSSKLDYGLYSAEECDTIKALFDKGVIKDARKPIRSLYIPYKKDALESPIWRDHRALELIKKGLCSYIKVIEQSKHDELSVAFHLLLALSKSVDAGDNVNIYNFNYTSVQMRGSLVEFPVHYVHGSCKDNNVIIGTQDATYMVPEYDFLQKVMDDNYAPSDIVSALADADEVIIFGHSLGENDSQYFERFFTHQAEADGHNKTEIVLFTYDTKSKHEIKRAIQDMINISLSSLFSTNQPTIIKTGELVKDKKALYDFLLKHNTNERFADDVITKLISKSS